MSRHPVSTRLSDLRLGQCLELKLEGGGQVWVSLVSGWRREGTKIVGVHVSYDGLTDVKAVHPNDTEADDGVMEGGLWLFGGIGSRHGGRVDAIVKR